MKSLTLIWFTFTLISLITLSSSFNFDNFDYKDYVVNPYRVLSVPPWSSMKVIKKRYHKLIKQYHPDKTKGETQEQFRWIQRSYEEIKKKREEDENSDVELAFVGIISNTIKDILYVEFFFGIVYAISYWIYKLQSWIVKPLFYLIIAFTVTENILPHYFKSAGEQYFYSFILGIAMMSLNSYVFWSCKRVTNKVEAKKTN